MDVNGLIPTKHYDLHRERCEQCGRVFLTVIDKEYWQIPLSRRRKKMCCICTLKKLTKNRKENKNEHNQ